MKDINKRIKGSGLSYYMPERKKEITYSVDMVKIKMNLSERFIRRIISDASVVQRLSNKLKLKEKHRYDDTLIWEYEAQYGLIDGYMLVRIRCNQNSGKAQCTIECNPNKCFIHPDCLCDIVFLLVNSIDYFVESLDVAMDIPVRMRNVQVRKDKRSETIYYRSFYNPTIYLGKRGKVGNVRVYDKQKESDLLFNLTRIELKAGNPLCDDFAEITKRNLPLIYVCESRNNDRMTEKNALSSTEYVLVAALRICPHRDKLFRFLDIKKRKKLEPYVFTSEEKVEFDMETINKVVYDFIKHLEVEDSIVCADRYIVGRNTKDRE